MGRLVPLAAFLLLAVLLGVGLIIADRKEEIPSPLVGQPVPDFALPDLHRPERTVTNDDLVGRTYVLNVWASWCVTCRDEHPVLTRLAEMGRAPVIGLVYRDEPADSLAWLDRFGDPWALHLADRDGSVGIDLGVVAAPETFVVDADGVIRYKHIGGLSWEVVERDILPLLPAAPETAP